MAFRYNAVVTRPNAGVQWFGDANPSGKDAMQNFVRSAPGFQSGTWQQHPSDSTKFLVTHTWDSEQSWKSMSDQLPSQPSAQACRAYHQANSITMTFFTATV